MAKFSPCPRFVALRLGIMFLPLFSRLGAKGGISWDFRLNAKTGGGNKKPSKSLNFSDFEGYIGSGVRI